MNISFNDVVICLVCGALVFHNKEALHQKWHITTDPTEREGTE